MAANEPTKGSERSCVATPDPVLVIFQAPSCVHCRTLETNWSVIQEAIIAEHPHLQIVTVNATTMQGEIDPTSVPKDLRRYAGWFPCVLLVPGNLWAQAIAHLGPENPVELRDGVQVMNGIIKNGKLQYVNKYDVRKKEAFVQWLHDAKANPDFQRVQNGTVPVTDTKKIVQISPIAVTDPVLVFYGPKKCASCDCGYGKWMDTIAKATERTPNLRFVSVTTDAHGQFDPNWFPRDLTRYKRDTPSILLVPGFLWDRAMKNLGPENPILLWLGVQVMNGEPTMNVRYAHGGWICTQGAPNWTGVPNRKDFACWLNSALANSEFKRVQEGPNTTISYTVISTSK